MQKSSTEIRVFISSTFHDLQSEREHLVKKIFPEIRTLCRGRGVTFTEVDLRWGVTEEQSALGHVLRTCLEEVDKCRPFFIGMFGSRYGWVPQMSDVEKDPELLARYPWIREAVLNGSSATELEIIQGVFQREGGGEEGERSAYFYRRRTDPEELENPEKLGELIVSLRNAGHPVRDFDDVEGLGRMIRDDLLDLVERCRPEEYLPTGVELKRRAHTAFAASRRRAYIPDAGQIERFTDWLDAGTSPLLISGPSGLGKSSLMASLIDRYRELHPGAFVIEHYIGATETSGSSYGVMRHVIEEMWDRFALDEEMPTAPEKIEREFRNLLSRLAVLAGTAEVRVLLAIDAVNQLGPVGRRMGWLPKHIPSGIRLMISTTPGETCDLLRARGYEELPVGPIDDHGVRRDIMVTYLQEFGKGISPRLVERITVEDPKSSSPLYLRLVAEELRLHGKRRSLPEIIDQFASAKDLMEVFQGVCERLERDFGEANLRNVLTLLWASRGGLNEVELLELTGLTRLELSRLLFALDYHLVRKDGLLGLFHDYLRGAIEQRYFSGETGGKETHLRLAAYFGRQSGSLRASRETIHQLYRADDRDGLAAALADIDRMMILQGEAEYDLLRFLATLQKTHDVEAIIPDSLRKWRRKGKRTYEEEEAVLERVAHILNSLQYWNASLQLRRAQLALVIRHADGAREGPVRLRIGQIYQQMDRADEAIGELELAEKICLEHNLISLLYNIYIDWGIVHYKRGEYDQALALFHKVETGAEGKDLHNYASVITNTALIHLDRGDYEQGLKYSLKSEGLSRELGNMASRIMSTGNAGIAYFHLGDYDNAVRCYRLQETLCREVGDRRALSRAIGNTASLFVERAEYEEAMAKLKEQEEICRELGEDRGIAVAQVNIGLIHKHLRNYRRGLEHLEEGLIGARKVGARMIEEACLQGIAEVCIEMLEESAPFSSDQSDGGRREDIVKDIVKRAEEALALSREIADNLRLRRQLFSGMLLHARLMHARGNPEAAASLLSDLPGRAETEDQLAETHYRLWKLFPGMEQKEREGHRKEGLRIYEELAAKTPRHLYHLRREELRKG